MAEPRREAILARLAIILGAIQGCGFDRNRVKPITEQELPLLILRDGAEQLAPPGNARPGRRLMRWIMTPEIEFYMKRRGQSDPNAALSGWQEQVLAALMADAPLAALLAGEKIAGCEFTALLPEDDPGFAGFWLAPELVYDKDLPAIAHL